MIKQGLLDKHGKPNEKTPGDYLSHSVANLSVDAPDSKKVKKEKDADYVVPSAGPEPTPKRKVRVDGLYPFILVYFYYSSIANKVYLNTNILNNRHCFHYNFRQPRSSHQLKSRRNTKRSQSRLRRLLKKSLLQKRRKTAGKPRRRRKRRRNPNHKMAMMNRSSFHLDFYARIS
jgi:hypothetical protein